MTGTRSCLLIDVRCLQDPNFVARGIGRHSLELLRHARNTPRIAACRLIGLIDPALPPLRDAARDTLDAVRTTAFPSTQNPVAGFLQLSPMTHDPLFVGRLLMDPAIPCAAVVYDFIPLDHPAHYLATNSARIDYHVRLRWLARYDRFLPISADAARRMQGLLGTAPHEVSITGAPLNPVFEAGRAERPDHGTAHFLVVGGDDPRKNPEFALAAQALNGGTVPLVITGVYPGREFPGAVMPGHVPEAELARLYRTALCVIAPSRAEGFSLPVIEAMAAGAPVLASDIPAHAELVEPGHLFPLDHPGTLASLLSQVQDPVWRAAAVAAQDAMWPRFRAAAVAGRAWRAVSGLLPTPAESGISNGLAAAVILRRARPRVALLTPLPPDRLGIAGYSAALCPALGSRVELDVFTATAAPDRPDGVQTLGTLSAVPLLSSAYDAVVSVLGNAAQCGDILANLLRYGGACIAHGGRMVDLYASRYGVEHTQRLAERELHRRLAPDELSHWLTGHTAPLAFLYDEIAAASAPLILHSRAGADAIAARTGVATRHLPFCLRRSWAAEALTPAARVRARDRLARFGAAPGTVVIATFGAVHADRAPEDCVWALHLLREWGVPARLHFVGNATGCPASIPALITLLGLQDHVWFAGDAVPEEVWQDHLLGADAALQLRLGGPGAVSGALSDCVGAGLRGVASAALADGIDAPGFVRRVPDQPSPVLVAEALAPLLDTPPPGQEAERQAYVETHRFSRYADELCVALGLV